MSTSTLPTHPSKRHPITGEPLRAIWVRPDGRAMWPIIGASEDPPADDATDDGKPDASGADSKSDDKPLGENGEKALRAERDARKALEGQLSDLRKNLAQVFGGDESDPQKGAAESLADIQSQIADMKHENAVLALANAHGIKDADDLGLLRATRDADALTKLAARLATTSDDGAGDDTKGARRPKPDRSQGSGSSESKASVSTGRELFAARRGKKSA